MSRFRALLLAAICLCVSAPAFAQFNGSIQGTVQDTTGAVIPGATVTVTNQATGVVSTVTTDSSGLYRVDHLAPGRYVVNATAASFSPVTSGVVQVQAESPRGLNLTMTAGPTTEQVTVTAGNDLLQTETANNQATISTREVLEIPQPGRDPYELLRTIPGVFGTGARQANGNAIALPQQVGPNGSASQIFQTENQVQVTANGQRVSANHYLVDGVQVDSLGNGAAA